MPNALRRRQVLVDGVGAVEKGHERAADERRQVRGVGDVLGRARDKVSARRVRVGHCAREAAEARVLKGAVRAARPGRVKKSGAERKNITSHEKSPVRPLSCAARP